MEDVARLDPPGFSAELRPNPPLSPRGAALVLGGFGVISLVAGLYMVSLGAWPVFGFMGLDALGLCVAFRVVSARARRREILRLVPGFLEILRIDGQGRRQRVALESAWLRVEHDGEAEWPAPLLLASRGRRVEVARFLGQDERREVADALRRALRGV